MLPWVREWGVVQSLEKHHQQAQLAQQAQREEEDRIQQVTTPHVYIKCSVIRLAGWPKLAKLFFFFCASSW